MKQRIKHFVENHESNPVCSDAIYGMRLLALNTIADLIAEVNAESGKSVAEILPALIENEDKLPQFSGPILRALKDFR